MIHDLTAEQLSPILRSLARLEDADRLPSDLKWGEWASGFPEAVSWALDALGKRKLSAAFRAEYRRVAANGSMIRSSTTVWESMVGDLVGKPMELPALPPGSFLVEALLTLDQPMMTRDDRLFSVSDNAVRKDRVFLWPHIAASSWKGAFRGAIHQMGWDLKKERSEFDRIWGLASGSNREDDAEAEAETEVKENAETSRAGRLNFYTTAFRKIGFRLLNPQDRIQRAGTNPVELEVVPERETGWFRLLYVPFDNPLASALPEAEADWGQVIALVLPAMLMRTGFGAKVSSGFGVMRDEVGSGRLSAVGADYAWHSEPFKNLSGLSSLALPGLASGDGHAL